MTATALVKAQLSSQFVNTTDIPDRLLLSLIARRYKYKNEGLFVDLDSFVLLEIAKFAGIMPASSGIRCFQNAEWNRTLDYLDLKLPEWRNVLPVASDRQGCLKNG